jgi:O-antigen biosynthesis protein
LGVRFDAESTGTQAGIPRGSGGISKGRGAETTRLPKVSVVVACHNGERTLAACAWIRWHAELSGLRSHPGGRWFHGSTAEITAEFGSVRYIHQPHQGLSVARNTGIARATGEVIAFTDADCRADEDWLRYLVGDLLATGYAGIGGPNYLPPEDSRFAAAVMASPGGPTHVMLTDREAEHVPGCNMAFHRLALEDIGGFDPVFRTAGDDVDLCWRLQAQGYRIGFSPAGFVWHYRRSTPAAYLGQQFGYGEAEALLARKHPGYFNFLGGGVWRGRIYAPAQAAVRLRRPIIYHGLFGGGLFQKLYAPVPDSLIMGATSLEYHALVNLPLLALATAFPVLWPVFGVSMALSLGVCGLAAVAGGVAAREARTLVAAAGGGPVFLAAPGSGLGAVPMAVHVAFVAAHDVSAAVAGRAVASISPASGADFLV